MHDSIHLDTLIFSCSDSVANKIINGYNLKNTQSIYTCEFSEPQTNIVALHGVNMSLPNGLHEVKK